MRMSLCASLAIAAMTAHLQSQNRPYPLCTPIEVNVERSTLLVVGTMLGTPTQTEPGFKIQDLGFIFSSEQKTLPEFIRYIDSLPLGRQSTLEVRLEKIDPAQLDFSGVPPRIRGTLRKDDGFYKLEYGGLRSKLSKDLFIFTHNQCIAAAIEQYLGPAALTFGVPSGT